jgi:hypothetical protein
MYMHKQTCTFHILFLPGAPDNPAGNKHSLLFPSTFVLRIPAGITKIAAPEHRVKLRVKRHKFVSL